MVRSAALKLALLAAAFGLLPMSSFAQVNTTCSQYGRTTYCNSYDYSSPNPALQNGMAAFGSALGERLREGGSRSEAKRQREAYAQVVAFAMDPAHPYFGMVRPRIADLLRTGQAQTLQEAYDRATAESPAVRAAMIASATP